MPIAMPDPPVPSGSDDPRFSPDSDRAASMVDIDFGPETILDEKLVDEDSPGSRGDETGLTAEVIRRNVKRGHQGY